MGKVKKVAKWAVPAFVDVDSQVEESLKDKMVQKALERYDGNIENFKNGLRGYIEYENQKNSRLRNSATTLDSANKALVPVDATLDAFSILGGIGYAAKGLVTLAKLPAYMAYDAYYLGKTHDLKGTLENTAYEAISWFVPGSIPHLLNRYTSQADRYATKKGIERFLYSLDKKLADVEELPVEERKGQKLEDMAKAA